MTNVSLADFLLARIDEDEAVAQTATQSQKWWDWTGSEHHKMASVRAHEDPYIALNITNGDAVHIARYDPRRILADSEAKRRIVEHHREPMVWIGPGPDDFLPGDYHTPSDHHTLRLLALPYADHPDYREEWKP